MRRDPSGFNVGAGPGDDCGERRERRRGGGGKGHRGKGSKKAAAAPSTSAKKPADPARPTRDDDAVVATLVRDAVARIVASGVPVTLAHGGAAANEPPP